MNTPIYPAYPEFYRNDQVELSVAIPLFNEAEVIAQLYKRLKTVLMPLGIKHELLFVDDGSSDNTAALLSSISRDDPSVTVVFLARHVGKDAALKAGLAQAGGRAVIIMDGDLQDPPELIPTMLKARYDGADVVLMRRRQPSGLSFGKQVARQCFHYVLDAVFDVGIPKNSMDFMLYTQEAVAALGLVVQRKQYMTAMFEWAGFRQTTIDYERTPRAAGSSKWSLPQACGYAPAKHTFSCRTELLLRCLMLLGLLTVLASALYACCALINTIILDNSGQTLPFSILMQALSWGGLLFLSAWIGKHIVWACTRAEHPRYAIKKLLRSTEAKVT